MAGKVLERFVTEYVFRSNTETLDRIERRLGRVRDRAESVSRAFTYVGTALTGTVAGMAIPIYQFEQKINALQAATNASAGDMALLRAEAQRLGETTQFSASQAAEAMKLLGQAGFSTEEIIAAMPGVMSMAAAGGLSMGEAADIAASTLAGFGLEAEEMTRVADILAASASSAKTTVAEMGESFTKVAPMANELGVPIESVASATATLQDRGISASEAGVHLRNIFLRLLNPAQRAKQAMDELGVKSEDFTDLIMGGDWEGALKMLETAGMSQKDAARIFGAYTVGAATALTKNMERVEELRGVVDNASGSADRMAKQMMEGLPGAWKLLQSKIESLILAIGEAGLTGTLITLSEWIVAVIDWFKELDPVLHTISGIVIGLGPVILAVGVGLKFIAIAIGPLILVLKGAITAFGILMAVLRANPIIALLSALALLIVYWDEVMWAIRTGAAKIKNWLIGMLPNWAKKLIGVEVSETVAETAPGASRASMDERIAEGMAGVAANTALLAPGSPMAQSTGVSIDAIEVNIDAAGADSMEIAQNISQALRDQVQTVVEASDTTILR